MRDFMSSLYQSVHNPTVLHSAAFGSSEEELEQELGGLGWTYEPGTGIASFGCCYYNILGFEIHIDLFQITGQIDLYGTLSDPRLSDNYWPGLDIGYH
jgi:hypothetical protein